MRTVCAWDRHTSYVTGTYRQHRHLVELTGGTPTRGKKGVRASYRHYFRLDYQNLEEQLSDGKIADVSLPEIKTAIEQLSFEERAELVAWLHGWNDDEWDEQMKRDIGSGKLDEVLHEVEEDIKSGRTREMP